MNEPYLAAVCHDIKSNTLEATWLQETATEIKRIRSRNYSPSQRDEFLADCGTDGQKYVDMAGWTDEYVAAYIAEEVRLAEEAAAEQAAKEQAEREAQEAAAKAEFDAEVARQAAILKAAQELVTQ